MNLQNLCKIYELAGSDSTGNVRLGAREEWPFNYPSSTELRGTAPAWRVLRNTGRLGPGVPAGKKTLARGGALTSSPGRVAIFTQQRRAMSASDACGRLPWRRRTEETSRKRGGGGGALELCRRRRRLRVTSRLPQLRARFAV